MEENSTNNNSKGGTSQQDTNVYYSKLHLLHKSTEKEDKQELAHTNTNNVQNNNNLQRTASSEQRYNFQEVLQLLLPGLAPEGKLESQTTIDSASLQAHLGRIIASMKEDEKRKQQLELQQQQQQQYQALQQQQLDALKTVQGLQVEKEDVDYQQMYKVLLVLQQQMVEDEERMTQLLSKRGEIMQAQLTFFEKEMKQSLSKFHQLLDENVQFQQKFFQSQERVFQLAEETMKNEVMNMIVELTQSLAEAFAIQYFKTKKAQYNQFDFNQEFANLLKEQVVQPFLQSCKSYVEQMDSVLERGWRQLQQELKSIKDKVISQRAQSLQKLSTIEEGLGGQIEDFIMQLDYQLQQSILKGSAIEDLIPNKEDPQVLIQALLETGQIDDAFRQCLTCKDDKVLSWMLQKLSSEQTLSTLLLTQPVLMGLVLQISKFLEQQDDWSVFLKWLQEALLLLDENVNDKELRVYMKKFLEDALEMLQQSSYDNLPFEQKKDVLLSIHLINSKLRSLDQNT